MGSPKRGTKCSFKLEDVICPDQQQAVSQITPELEVSGVVVFLSDHGHQPEHFAVIEVNGIASPLIVPVERLLVTQETSAEASKPAGSEQVDAVYERVT